MLSILYILFNPHISAKKQWWNQDFEILTNFPRLNTASNLHNLDQSSIGLFPKPRVYFNRYSFYSTNIVFSQCAGH